VHVYAGTVARIFTGVVETVHATASPVLKPLPVIVTAVYVGPALGVKVRDGVLVTTMNWVPAASPVLPVTVTV
jgi:hypothetical protein